MNYLYPHKLLSCKLCEGGQGESMTHKTIQIFSDFAGCQSTVRIGTGAIQFGQ